MTGVGLCLPQLGPHVRADIVAEFARRAEAMGYEALWVQDHFMYPEKPIRGYGGPDRMPPHQYKSVFAPTETLAFVAGITSKVRLGTSILVAGNHWPVPLAQRLATIDQMCNGRLIVGLGVGWNAEEHTASGTEIETRGRRMDDFIPAMLACWQEDPVSYDGPTFSIPSSFVSPKPVQSPRPKLLSGMWSADGMARTAKWFDAWNPAGMPIGKVQKIVAGLNEQRSAEQKPLEIYYRSFIQGPLAPRAADGDNMAALVADATACREAGFVELTLEHNFWEDIEKPEDWLDVPERFLPVVEAARG